MFQNHLYERFAVISLPLKIATWILSSDTRLENNGLYLFKFFENKGPLLWFKLPQNTTEKFIMIFLLRKNQNVCCILCCFLEEEDKQSISWYQTKHNNYEQNNYEHTSQTTYLPVFQSLFFFLSTCTCTFIFPPLNWQKQDAFFDYLVDIWSPPNLQRNRCSSFKA